MDWLLDTTTTSGNIIVKVRRNSAAGGTAYPGRASLKIVGPMYQVKKGA